MPGQLLLLLRLALQGLSWASLAVYAFWTIAFIIPDWSWEWRGTPTTWEKWRTKNTIRYQMSADGTGSTILYGWDLLSILMWWFPALVAALCAHLTAALPHDATIRGGSSSRDRADNGGVMSGWTSVKRMLVWQLPPRGFWLYWCDGLNIGELLAVAAWIIVHVVGLVKFLDYYGKRLDAWDRVGWSASVPQSVLWLELISLSFAWLSFIDLAALFLPISHNGLFTVLAGLPYSALIRFHRWIGHSTMWMIGLHGIFYYMYWIADPNTNFWEEFFDWGGHAYINIFAGSLAFFFGCALWITSLNWIRRKYFEVFYKTHIIGFIGFIFFAFLHYVWVWTVVVPGLAIYAADYIARLTQSQFVTLAVATTITPDNNIMVMELPAKKGFSKCPIQDIFLLLPSISRWQWHPFTIMGRRDGDDGRQIITVGMKAYGRWTKEAVQQLGLGDPVPVRVTGTLDGMTLDELQEKEHLVMVAGGIAATPIISILSEISSAKATAASLVSHICKVELVFVARSASEFTMLPSDLLLAASGDSSWLTISLFCTSSKLPDKLPKIPDVAAVKDPDDIPVATVDTHCPFPTTIKSGFINFPTASAFFWNTARPMEYKSFGTLYMLAVLTIAFLGAFLGLVLSQAMSMEFNARRDTTDSYYKLGLTTFLSIAIMTIGLPMMLVVFPVNSISYIRTKESAIKPTSISSKDTGSSGHGAVSLADDGLSIGIPETGISFKIAQGRPDLATMMETCRQATTACTISVFCAGPVPLINSAAQLVWDMNDKKTAGMPHMEFRKFAFEL